MVWHLPRLRLPLPVVVPDSAAATNTVPDRGHWGSKAEFILSCMGMSIGMGNVWRFPQRAYQNGGAAFLFPYFILLLLIGSPMYYAECILGQFTSLGPVSAYNFCPAMRGVGLAASITSLFVALYYNMFMVYSFVYLAFCFSPELPWTSCLEWWGAEANCYVRGEKLEKCTESAISNITNLTSTNSPCKIGWKWKSAGAQFWEKYILNLETDIDISNLGEIQWKVLVSLMVCWLIIFLCISRGIKTSGKIVYVTAVFPYVVLAVLVVMGLTLDGAMSGLTYLFKPEWNELLKPKVWSSAAGQLFFSLNVAYGGIVMFSSYNLFQNKVKSDALLVSIFDSMTSVVAAISIFCILGNMKETLKLGSIKEVAEEGGPGLAFMVVPEAFLNLGIPHFWCALFMLMLIALAIDSEFAYVETFLTTLYDEIPTLRRHKVITCAIMCFVCCIIGISFTTQGGMYVLEMIDQFTAENSAILVAIFEMISIFWIYGLRKFLDDTEFMLGKRPGYYWRICWTIIDPVLLVLFLCAKLYDFNPKQYGGTGEYKAINNKEKDYPWWAVLLGWILTIITIIPIPIFLIYYLVTYKRKGLSMKEAFKPNDAWGPSDPYMHSVYKEWKAKEPRPGSQKRSLPDFSGFPPGPGMLHPSDEMQTQV